MVWGLVWGVLDEDHFRGHEVEEHVGLDDDDRRAAWGLEPLQVLLPPGRAGGVEPPLHIIVLQDYP